MSDSWHRSGRASQQCDSYSCWGSTTSGAAAWHAARAPAPQQMHAWWACAALGALGQLCPAWHAMQGSALCRGCQHGLLGPDAATSAPLKMPVLGTRNNLILREVAMQVVVQPLMCLKQALLKNNSVLLLEDGEESLQTLLCMLWHFGRCRVFQLAITCRCGREMADAEQNARLAALSKAGRAYRAACNLLSEGAHRKATRLCQSCLRVRLLQEQPSSLHRARDALWLADSTVIFSRAPGGILNSFPARDSGMPRPCRCKQRSWWPPIRLWEGRTPRWPRPWLSRAAQQRQPPMQGQRCSVSGLPTAHPARLQCMRSASGFAWGCPLCRWPFVASSAVRCDQKGLISCCAVRSRKT